MSSFRIVDPLVVNFDSQGRLLTGGYFKFFESGTDTPMDVYSDPSLSTDIGSQVALGVDGRISQDVWGNVAYRVRLYTSADVLVKEIDPVEPSGGATQNIPALVTDYFLTNDGANLLWAAIRQLPDPTGQSGNLLTTDGVNYLFQSIAALNIPTITTTATSLTIGDTLFQWGTDTMPASGSVTSVKAVTFGTPFSGLPAVMCIAKTNSQPAGPVVCYLTSDPTSTGFSVTGDIAEGTSSGANFTQPAPFNWMAMGPA